MRHLAAGSQQREGTFSHLSGSSLSALITNAFVSLPLPFSRIDGELSFLTEDGQSP